LEKRLKFVLILFFGSLQFAVSQQITGLQYSNYGGLYRTTYNPATLGASRYKWQVNIGSLGGSINRRYFVFLGKNSLLYPLLVSHSTKELYGRSRTMGSLTAQNPVYLVSEIRWPSAMVSLGNNQGIALQFRSRGYVQGQNIPDPVKNLYFKRLDTGSTPVISKQAWGDFSLVQQSFSEVAVSYGAALVNTESQKFKVGATVKRIVGARIGYLNGSANNFSIRSVGTETSELVINNFNYESGYSQTVQTRRIGNLFNAEKYGSGWGFDLGASYELGAVWVNDKEQYDASPEYLIRLGASITDVGAIHYKTENSRVIRGSKAETVINQADLETISDKGPEGLMALLPVKSDSSFSRNVRLPQALHLEADVQLMKGFFLNLSRTTRFNPRKNESLDVFLPNAFTITPRFEDEDSDFAFPISFIDGNKKASIGVLVHFGPVFLGVSSLTALTKKSGGSMAYVGVSAWKLKNKKKTKSFSKGRK
jgi:hypothetical protein